MIKGTTESGFEFVVSDTIGDDFEFLELVAEAESNTLLIGRIIERLLGKEQKKALMEHLRGEDGIVHTTSMVDAFAEIMKAIPGSKN